MTNRNGSPSLGRLLTYAAACGAAAGLLALLAVQAVVWLLPPAPGVIGANIGLGMAALAAQPVVSSLLAWAGLRLLGVPSAGWSALVAMLFYAVFLLTVMTSELGSALPLALENPLAAMVAYAVLEGALPMLVATMAGTACLRALGRRPAAGPAAEGP
ncbi:hypothetical protein ACFO4E_17430 [Nocardiopsis mangrovi]|uniref:Uncharacterized protein n=1 Tax=Nocardiopsis mangrovi TaxID=1179818 RepID=A0ABV9DXZ8_9ACTN